MLIIKKYTNYSVVISKTNKKIQIEYRSYNCIIGRLSYNYETCETSFLHPAKWLQSYSATTTRHIGYMYGSVDYILKNSVLMSESFNFKSCYKNARQWRVVTKDNAEICGDKESSIIGPYL